MIKTLLQAGAILALFVGGSAMAGKCCDVDPATGAGAFGRDYNQYQQDFDDRISRSIDGSYRELSHTLWQSEFRVRQNVRDLLGFDGERAYFGSNVQGPAPLSTDPKGRFAD